MTVLVSKDDVNGITPVYDAPDGRRLLFPDGELWSYTFRRNRLVVRVTQGSEGDEWVQAELPVRPSGVRGWIRTEDFNWSTVNHHVLVDLSDRLVALFDGDELITYTRAIVGKPSTPTPALRGFIVEKLPNHNQQNASVVLGDWVLMLSFFSEALSSFSGGLPPHRVARHAHPRAGGRAAVQRLHPYPEQHHRDHRPAGPAGHGGERQSLRGRWGGIVNELTPSGVC